MTDLILHIGLPKTGTTTIQHRLLSGQPGFLGKDKSRPGLWSQNHTVRRLRELVFRHYFAATAADREVVQAQARSWCRELEREWLAQSAARALIISDEVFSWWPTDPYYTTTEAFTRSTTRRRGVGRGDQPPITIFLQQVLCPLWTVGHIRVAMTLRNQPDWLASLYAQGSGLVRGASTADFEQQVRRLLRTADSYIHWWHWIADLKSVVGAQRVGVFLTEEMGSTEFWDGLADFMELESESIRRVAEPLLQRDNVRRADERGGWQLKKFNPVKILDRDWPPERCPRLRRFTLGGFRATRRLHGPLLRMLLDRGRTAELYLRPPLRAEILAHVATSNACLGQWLGRDLAPLGYGLGQE